MADTSQEEQKHLCLLCTGKSPNEGEAPCICVYEKYICTVPNSKNLGLFIRTAAVFCPVQLDPFLRNGDNGAVEEGNHSFWQIHKYMGKRTNPSISPENTVTHLSHFQLEYY